jgi:hypothetical protein
MCESRNTQPLKLRFRALLTEEASPGSAIITAHLGVQSQAEDTRSEPPRPGTRFYSVGPSAFFTAGL